MRWAAVLALVCAAFLARAESPTDEARRLKDETTKFIGPGSTATLDKQTYSACIAKLERALQLLENSGQRDSTLSQEIASSLFWARRFSTIDGMPTLPRQWSEPSAPSPTVPANVPAQPAKSPEAAPPVDLSKRAFEQAEAFEKAKSDDPFVVSLRWMQVAEELSSTEYGERARKRAWEAAQQFSSRFGGADQSPEQSEAVRLLREADALAGESKWEEAFEKYGQSLKARETVAAHRRFGHALFKAAEAVRKEVEQPFAKAHKDLETAQKGAWKTEKSRMGSRRYFDPNYPPLLAAQKRLKELMERSETGLAWFNRAQDQFKAVLRLMPAQRDLDAAAHLGFCYAARGDASMRAQAAAILQQALADYTPFDGAEKKLIEKCNSELARIKQPNPVPVKDPPKAGK